MDNLITIRTFGTSAEMEIVKAYLESFEIESFAKDDILSQSTYPADVFGGVKLQVWEKDFEQAASALIEGGYLQKEDFEPSAEIKFINKMLDKFRK